jgi:hypothetical protein
MRILLAVVLAGAAFAARAEDVVGRVRAVYFEAARGVLVEPRMPHPPNAIRWADVETPSSKRLLVRVPVGIPAAPGDVVAIRLAEPKTSALAEILPSIAENRAIEGGSESGSSVGR